MATGTIEYRDDGLDPWFVADEQGIGLRYTSLNAAIEATFAWVDGRNYNFPGVADWVIVLDGHVRDVVAQARHRGPLL